MLAHPCDQLAPYARTTTLGEKLCLAWRADERVKARGERQRVRPDWVAMDRERDISGPLAAKSFHHDGLPFNRLDTVGHRDFCDDTYRTLTRSTAYRTPPPPQTQGSINSNRQPAKSPTFRVASAAPRERAIAAMRASASEIGRPARRRPAAMSANSRAAALSKGNTDLQDPPRKSAPRLLPGIAAVSLRATERCRRGAPPR